MKSPTTQPGWNPGKAAGAIAQLRLHASQLRATLIAKDTKLDTKSGSNLELSDAAIWPEPYLRSKAVKPDGVSDLAHYGMQCIDVRRMAEYITSLESGNKGRVRDDKAYTARAAIEAAKELRAKVVAIDPKAAEAVPVSEHDGNPETEWVFGIIGEINQLEGILEAKKTPSIPDAVTPAATTQSAPVASVATPIAATVTPTPSIEPGWTQGLVTALYGQGDRGIAVLRQAISAGKVTAAQTACAEKIFNLEQQLAQQAVGGAMYIALCGKIAAKKTEYSKLPKAPKA